MIRPDNLCFGCVGVIDGKMRNAPCCWNSEVYATATEYVEHFLRFYLAGDERIQDVDISFPNGDVSQAPTYAIQLEGACPHLDEDTGACSIQNEKPIACATAEVGHFPACIKK